MLGDNLAQVVAHGFAHPAQMGMLDAWIVTVGFWVQLYFDFSGYTDIGRGSALLFGYKLPENFNMPFLACSPVDFWRRWHISLTSWLKDYLFIPLGGSRVGPWRLRWNLFVTMVLGGLWHGAAWHYVVWGAFHGTNLVLCKWWQDVVSQVPLLARLRPHPLWHWSGVALNMFLVSLAAVIFRAENMPHALNVAQRLFILAPSGEVTKLLLVSTFPVSYCLYAIFLAGCFIAGRASSGGIIGVGVLDFVWNRLSRWWAGSLPAKVVAYASVALLILGFAPGHVEPFIYFQF